MTAILVRCDALFWGKWFPTFRTNLLPFSAVSSTSRSTLWAAWPCSWRDEYRLKRRAVSTQQHGVTSQKNRIFSNAAVGASNVTLRQKLVQIECRYEWRRWRYSPESIYCRRMKFTQCSYFVTVINHFNLNPSSNSGHETSRSTVVCLVYWNVLNIMSAAVLRFRYLPCWCM